MNLKLNKKIALVSGSSKGIGWAIAKQLYSEGCYVILNGRDISILKSKKALLGRRAFYIEGDVTKSEQTSKISKFIENSFGKLDILICNVGSGQSVLPGKETELEWNKMFSKNLFSTSNLINSCRYLLSKGKGSIVCISSICGIEFLGAPLTYSASKAALNSYIKGISRILASENIRINAVAPGNIIFKGSVWEKKMKNNPKKINSMIKKEVALMRLGKPDEIANFVLFLASEKSSFSTGSLIVVDGGQIRS